MSAVVTHKDMLELGERLRFPLHGVKTRNIIYGDIGSRNLAFSWVRQHAFIPKPATQINPAQWLVPGTTNQCAITVMGVFKVDLTPKTNIPEVRAYMNDELKGKAKTVDFLSKRQPKPPNPDADGPLYTDVPTVRQALTGKRSSGKASNYRLWNERLTTLFCSDSMASFFSEPVTLVFEAQLDQLEVDGKSKKRSNKFKTARNFQILQMICSIIWGYDLLFFGFRRAILLGSLKYGTRECWRDTCALHPDVRDSYGIRKLAAVVMTNRICQAFGLATLANFIAETMKKDDICESITGAIGFLYNTQRSTPYSDLDIQRCLSLDPLTITIAEDETLDYVEQECTEIDTILEELYGKPVKKKRTYTKRKKANAEEEELDEGLEIDKAVLDSLKPPPAKRQKKQLKLDLPVPVMTTTSNGVVTIAAPPKKQQQQKSTTAKKSSQPKKKKGQAKNSIPFDGSLLDMNEDELDSFLNGDAGGSGVDLHSSPNVQPTDLFPSLTSNSTNSDYRNVGAYLF